MLRVGERAPDFKAEASTGGMATLKQFRGKKVILYFYPKDNTSGCTREACDFRDHRSHLKRKKVVVLGVSPDSLASHAKFKAKYDLDFTLLSDPDHEIAEAYGVWVEKKLYGRTYRGIQRSTFIIDETGKLAAVFPKVKVKGHVEELLETI